MEQNQVHHVKLVSSRNNYKNKKGIMSNINEVEEEEEMDLRRGPWTVEEDFTLINYIAHHGEGRWNSLARSAGLKRTGKSCRLRWLNYLRPDVRRGDITLEEQLLILELHSRWGNRWSKIAQHLPGRTDNEIKNYWRTRVQKHAKQLKCDVNSKQFKDTMRYLWMPRLVERIQAASSAAAAAVATCPTTTNNNNQMGTSPQFVLPHSNFGAGVSNSSAAAASSESFGTPVSEITECNYNNYHQVNQVINNNNNNQNQDYYCYNQGNNYQLDCFNLDFLEQNWSQWMDGGDVSENFDDVWFLQQQQQLNNNV
ncbi:hypothetical protein ACJIZ3_013511 [Penstemon smallii]|uniref:Uncharacterized protein n=1 Tax=Penstemon smallii TaxID=265156 RepID=A0ABD3RHB6_9LAMI